MYRRTGAAALAAALACCGLAAGAPAAQAETGTPPSGDIALYPMTVFSSTQTEDLTTGPDGDIWYTMQSAQSPAIGVMTTDGTVLATYHTARNCDPGDIVSGPDDALWFDCSSYGSSSWIGEITTAGVQTLYPMPAADGGSVQGVTVGADGNLWFTDDAYNADNGNGYIGVMTPQGAVTQWALPFEFLPNGLDDDIALGPDGNVWLAGDDGDGTTVLAFATPTGAISDVMEPTGDGENEGITAGPGGDLYFTDRDSVYDSARLGWINAADQVNYTDLPPGFVPGQPGVGPDGDVYIAGSSGGLDGLLYFSPADFSTAFYELPNPYDYYAQHLAAGPDGNEYFTNPATQSVGRFAIAEPDATALTIAAPSGTLYSGQSGAVVATLTPGYSTDPTPTGSVAFFDDGVALATIPVAPDGTADLPLSDLSGGGNTVYATYSGDGNFGPVSTQFLGVGITADPTTTTLTSSQNPSSTGQSVTVTASVAADPPGGGVPTGAVQFTVDGVPEGGFSLDGNGDATFNLTGLTAGTHTVAAQYIPAQSAAGGYDFAGSTASLTQTVNQPPAGVGIDQTVTATGTGTVTTAAFSTAGPRLLVAFTSADGSSAKQTTTVSGAGLTWTLAARENAKGGAAEIWTATASGPLSDVAVTSALKTGGYDQQLTVVAFTGAAGTGATAIAAKAKGAPSVALATTAAGSWVFGVGEDYSAAAARTLGAGQTLVSQWVDTAPGETFWAQRENAPTAASGTSVTIGDTAPTADTWDLAAVEVLAAQ
jgi:Bacterial Ig-like domain (group 3)